MADKYQKLRQSLSTVPCVTWSASRGTISIDETDDWPSIRISIAGYHKQVSRGLARYIADANPAVIQALLDERNELLFIAQEFIDNTYIPDANCRCHISPPCGDCVDYSSVREAMDMAKAIIAMETGAQS